MDVMLEVITAAEARPLRRGLLHPGLAPDAVDYPGDADDQALHVGAFFDGVLIGVGSVHPQAVPNGERTATWRLRDLAVEHGHRGMGTGKMILGRLLDHAGEHGGTIVWAAVRLSAVGFFEHAGFVGFEAQWADPNEGPQLLMWSEVRPLLRDWQLQAES